MSLPDRRAALRLMGAGLFGGAVIAANRPDINVLASWAPDEQAVDTLNTPATNNSFAPRLAESSVLAAGQNFKQGSDRLAVISGAASETEAKNEQFCRVNLELGVVRFPESFRPTVAGLRYVVWGHGSDPDKDGVIYEIAEDQLPKPNPSEYKRQGRIIGDNKLVKAKPNGHLPCPEEAVKDCVPTTQFYAAQLDENGTRYPVTPAVSKPIQVDCSQPQCDAFFVLGNKEKAPAATATPTEAPATFTPTPSPTIVSTHPAKLPDTGGGPR
jgi:hypothetical protein